ncbi:hypothetical protein [Phyllobacterium sp. OV277]|uniref:helix-turn-helix domain-containing transcriptional regulator n=1 Tax=Phyllobacterium sp. OV277 TaxID=1882772 RepID=UPI00088C9647|nr:hypothetical protein [Phyllobacterium sp. OV277]SDP57771.1 probable addiction module antidote protein [Phyllobacterium sp. OV277]
MMPLKTTAFDPARYLDSLASQAELLKDAFETGDANYIADARGVVARAGDMAQSARKTRTLATLSTKS